MRKKLGLCNDMDFNMPISMSSFLGNMLSDYEDEAFYQVLVVLQHLNVIIAKQIMMNL